jgi:hypothetical protein
MPTPNLHFDGFPMRGRGLGSQSSDPDLLVSGCTRARQTAWVEDQFTVTSSVGIRNRDKRVADIVVRELKRAKPDVWGWIQAQEVWSTEEESNMWSGHFWICKLGTVPGSMSCVEKKFELQVRKWEEYKGTRYSDGDSALVVDLWLHRVADDLSGLTFQEWDPSASSDDTSAPVAMLVNVRWKPRASTSQKSGLFNSTRCLSDAVVRVSRQ